MRRMTSVFGGSPKPPAGVPVAPTYVPADSHLNEQLVQTLLSLAVGRMILP